MVFRSPKMWGFPGVRMTSFSQSLEPYPFKAGPVHFLTVQRVACATRLLLNELTPFSDPLLIEGFPRDSISLRYEKLNNSVQALRLSESNILTVNGRLSHSRSLAAGISPNRVGWFGCLRKTEPISVRYEVSVGPPLSS